MSFDTISPGPMVTVGELLSELSTIATLRIQILRPKTSLIQDIKDKLLRLLLIQSYNLLLRSGCPLDTVSPYLSFSSSSSSLVSCKKSFIHLFSISPIERGRKKKHLNNINFLNAKIGKKMKTIENF